MQKLSRNFSDLNRGEEYDRVKPVIHIGILDFRLDPEDERFYSENVLMDRRTGEVYSEKLQLNELSLKNIEHATKEQREARERYNLDFKTWQSALRREKADRNQVFLG